jgi:hypothetical protein
VNRWQASGGVWLLGAVVLLYGGLLLFMRLSMDG